MTDFSLLNLKSLSVLVRPQESMAADMQLPGFLRLPYEIREMIYKLLFISNQWIIVETRSAHSARRNKLYCYKLSKVWVGCPDMGWSGQLLRVCKLFHAEGAEFLYRHNKFEISLQTLQQTFLPTIGKRNASYIRYMEIARIALGESVATRTIPELLKALPNLRCLYFTPGQEKCNYECQKYCKHKPWYLRILVLRLAQLATTTHPHLTRFLEFKCAGNRRLTMVWFKFSDQDSGSLEIMRVHARFASLHVIRFSERNASSLNQYHAASDSNSCRVSSRNTCAESLAVGFGHSYRT